MTYRSLFCDVSDDGDLDKSKLSLGRIMLWIAFGYSTYFWFNRPILEFPETLFWFLNIMIGYNFFKKGMPLFDKFLIATSIKKG